MKQIVEELMKVVDVEEEELECDLVSTQGFKKRPREGPGYFGLNNNKASGKGS